jgi:hypothetical protein
MLIPTCLIVRLYVADSTIARHFEEGQVVKLNGSAAQTPDLAVFTCNLKLVRLVAFLHATGYGLCLGREFPRLHWAFCLDR